MSQQTIDGLNGVLADAVVFYHKMHHYHWHVSGRDFFLLHEQFEELYTRWAQVIDEVAERVVTLGGRAHATLAAALEASALQEDADYPDAGAMVAATVADLDTQRGRLIHVAEQAEADDDRATVGMMDELAAEIEKRLWMWRAWQA